MPRRPRRSAVDGTFHVIRRGHNRAPCFLSDGDRAHYLSLLAHYATNTGTRIHAYVLMTNHVHLLVSTSVPGSVSRLMYEVGARYSRAINRKISRTGTLWEGRVHALPVRSDAYVLACYRYIELNPIRAGLVRQPDHYRWSSHAANCGAIPCSWLSPHPTYADLGAAPGTAAEHYRRLFDVALDDIVVANLRTVGEPPGPMADPGSRG